MRQFTEEQIIFCDAYRKFLGRQIVPHMEAWREAGIVDRSAFKKAGDQGFLITWADEKYGGIGDPEVPETRVPVREVNSDLNLRPNGKYTYEGMWMPNSSVGFIRKGLC